MIVTTKKLFRFVFGIILLMGCFLPFLISFEYGNDDGGRDLLLTLATALSWTILAIILIITIIEAEDRHLFTLSWPKSFSFPKYNTHKEDSITDLVSALLEAERNDKIELADKIQDKIDKILQ